jgi:hypothetical protein
MSKKSRKIIDDLEQLAKRYESSPIPDEMGAAGVLLLISACIEDGTWRELYSICNEHCKWKITQNEEELRTNLARLEKYISGI